MNGLLTAQQGKQVAQLHRDLIKDISKHTSELIKSFDIKEHMIFAPIAKDWKQYNSYDNRGELISSRL
jgi:hypothetical protein